MSTETSAWAKLQKCGCPKIKAVLIELANWARPDGICEYRSNRNIHEATEVSVRTIQRALKKLETPVDDGGLGLIRRIPRHRKDGGQDANQFALVGYQYPHDTVTPPHDKMARGGVTSDRGPRVTVSPLIRNINLDSNTPLPPASGGRKIRAVISDDWKAPLIAELPPAAQAFALGWPDGAYAAQTEAFIQFHRGTGGRRADWDALWAAWVSKNHEAVMRAAKAGVAYAAPSQPRSASGSGGARAKEPTAAKAREDARSSEIHDALRKAVGQAMWADWWESAAIILIDDVLTVVAPSAFHRSWLEDHHEDALRLAVEQVGFAVEIIRWEVAAPAKKQKGKSK